MVWPSLRIIAFKIAKKIEIEILQAFVWPDGYKMPVSVQTSAKLLTNILYVILCPL